MMRTLILAAIFATFSASAMAQDDVIKEVARSVAIATAIAEFEDRSDLTRYADRTEEAIRFWISDEHGTRFPRKCGVPETGIGECVIGIGLYALDQATVMLYTIAIGNYSGTHLTSESHDLLIGDCTDAPGGRDGFVNIDNKFCGWRDTGEVVPCPAPTPECIKLTL